MSSYRIALLSSTVALATAVAPAAAAPAPDLRSPDARDAARAAAVERYYGSFRTARGATADLRSPDARDAARGPVPAAGAAQDLRSPDARDATPGAAPARPGVEDLRSPDARDAVVPIGRGARSAREASDPAVGARMAELSPAAPGRAVPVSASDGFAWGDAAIGAGGALGV